MGSALMPMKCWWCIDETKKPKKWTDIFNTGPPCLFPIQTNGEFVSFALSSTKDIFVCCLTKSEAVYLLPKAKTRNAIMHCCFVVCRLHEFCWHGTDPNNKTNLLRGQDTFTKLLVIPNQFYYNVSCSFSFKPNKTSACQINCSLYQNCNCLRLMKFALPTTP